MDKLRQSRPVIVGAAVISVMVALGVVKDFATGTAPWYFDRFATVGAYVADWAPVVVAGLSAGAAVYFWLQYRRYRDAMQRVVRDYYVGVSELHHVIDPVKYGHISAGIGMGWADPAFAEPVYDRYGLPHEKRYGG